MRYLLLFYSLLITTTSVNADAPSPAEGISNQLIIQQAPSMPGTCHLKKLIDEVKKHCVNSTNPCACTSLSAKTCINCILSNQITRDCVKKRIADVCPINTNRPIEDDNHAKSNEVSNKKPPYCDLKKLPALITEDCNFPQALHFDCKDAACIEYIVKTAAKLDRGPCVALRLRQLYQSCYPHWTKNINAIVKQKSQRRYQVPGAKPAEIK